MQAICEPQIAIKCSWIVIYCSDRGFFKGNRMTAKLFIETFG